MENIIRKSETLFTSTAMILAGKCLFVNSRWVQQEKWGWVFARQLYFELPQSVWLLVVCHCLFQRHMQHCCHCSIVTSSSVIYIKKPTWCSLAVCLLATAKLLYMFRSLFESIFRSTRNYSSSLWRVTWEGLRYPASRPRVEGFYTESDCVYIH